MERSKLYYRRPSTYIVFEQRNNSATENRLEVKALQCYMSSPSILKIYPCNSAIAIIFTTQACLP